MTMEQEYNKTADIIDGIEAKDFALWYLLGGKIDEYENELDSLYKRQANGEDVQKEILLLSIVIRGAKEFRENLSFEVF